MPARKLSPYCAPSIPSPGTTCRAGPPPTRGTGLYQSGLYQCLQRSIALVEGGSVHRRGPSPRAIRLRTSRRWLVRLIAMPWSPDSLGSPSSQSLSGKAADKLFRRAVAWLVELLLGRPPSPHGPLLETRPSNYCAVPGGTALKCRAASRALAHGGIPTIMMGRRSTSHSFPS